jgi:hypothetical protein
MPRAETVFRRGGDDVAADDQVDVFRDAGYESAQGELGEPGDATEAGGAQAADVEAGGAVELSVARDGGGEDTDVGVGELRRDLVHPGLDAASRRGEIPGQEQDLHGSEKLKGIRAVVDPATRST